MKIFFVNELFGFRRRLGKVEVQKGCWSEIQGSERNGLVVGLLADGVVKSEFRSGDGWRENGSDEDTDGRERFTGTEDALETLEIGGNYCFFCISKMSFLLIFRF